MDIDLRNRIALVTGSSKGIGKEIAKTLAEAGADVVLCGRDAEALARAKSEVAQAGTNVYTARADVTQPAEVQSLFRETIKPLGKLDILVNNVGGVPRFGDFETLTPADWLDALNLNFMSMVLCSREALPWLKQSGDGRIVNISTVPARQPGKFNPHYSAAKAAMLNASKYLANNFAADKILVNAICPSTIVGGNWDERVLDRAKRENVPVEEARRIMEREEKGKVPLGELGMPRDIAAAVAFLVSPAARFITGVCLDVDGGVVRSVL